ncbi:MAG TPA: hypothetical protein PLP98_14600, partial [Plasticicumulans sp.]|nr:hypothetical protein [Plasticicumulans sp.]
AREHLLSRAIPNAGFRSSIQPTGWQDRTEAGIERPDSSEAADSACIRFDPAQRQATGPSGR